MKYILKNRKLFAVVMLVVMMSSVLVLPASALLNYGMGGVSFTDSNGVQYAEGFIWNYPYSDESWDYEGRLECDYNAFLIVEITAETEKRTDRTYMPFSADDVQLSSTWANAELYIDMNYIPYSALADFYVDDVHKSYSRSWNNG